jgi:hypothetical protein
MNFRRRIRSPPFNCIEASLAQSCLGGKADFHDRLQLDISCVCSLIVSYWPLGAVTIDRLGTTAFESAADQMSFPHLVALASSWDVIVLHRLGVALKILLRRRLGRSRSQSA